MLSVEWFGRKFQTTTVCTQIIIYSPITVTFPRELLSSNKQIYSALLNLVYVQKSGVAELVYAGTTALCGRARCVLSVGDTDGESSYGEFNVECKIYCDDSDVLTLSTSSIITHARARKHHTHLTSYNYKKFFFTKKKFA
jgi:hypothetical protein